MHSTFICAFCGSADIGTESLILWAGFSTDGGRPFESRWDMTQSIICGRAFEFAVRIVRVCERMAARGSGARHIAKQLIRCGTSIGANAEEAQEGQSKADYIAKMCVSSKEARETAYWLRLAIAVSSLKRGEVEWN